MIEGYQCCLSFKEHLCQCLCWSGWSWSSMLNKTPSTVLMNISLQKDLQIIHSTNQNQPTSACQRVLACSAAFRQCQWRSSVLGIQKPTQTVKYRQPTSKHKISSNGPAHASASTSAQETTPVIILLHGSLNAKPRPYSFQCSFQDAAARCCCYLPAASCYQQPCCCFLPSLLLLWAV